MEDAFLLAPVQPMINGEKKRDIRARAGATAEADAFHAGVGNGEMRHMVCVLIIYKMI